MQNVFWSKIFEIFNMDGVKKVGMGGPITFGCPM